MRTTIRIRDELLERARRKAAKDNRTLTSLIEEGLRIVLAEPKHEKQQRIELPVSKSSGGVLPGVDINNAASILDLMEGQ